MRNDHTRHLASNELDPRGRDERIVHDERKPMTLIFKTIDQLLTSKVWSTTLDSNKFFFRLTFNEESLIDNLNTVLFLSSRHGTMHLLARKVKVKVSCQVMCY